MQQSEKQLIDEKFRGVYSRLDANNELIHQQLKQLIDLQEKTHEQALKTNGRVTSLEKQTLVIRWITEKPFRFIGVIGIAMILYNNIPESFWKLIKLF